MNEPIAGEKKTLSMVVSEVVEVAQEILSKVNGTPPTTGQQINKLAATNVIDGNIESLQYAKTLLREVDAKLTL